MRNSNFTEVEWIVATDGAGQPIIEVAPPVTANTYTRELGHKQYEMSNHLGNCASPYASPKRSIRDSHPVRNETGVLVVVNDIKMTVISGNTITGYRAQVISATDYSPFVAALSICDSEWLAMRTLSERYECIFTPLVYELESFPRVEVGVALEGRTHSCEGYRYGFTKSSFVLEGFCERFAVNGKEKDDEGMGGGGQTYDYGFRIYNPGLAKFLSVDPLIASYPWYTPYQFAGNIPIKFIDLDGKEPATPGCYDGEVRVAPINNQDVINEIQYWIWAETEVQIPYEVHSDWQMISGRLVEIVEYQNEEEEIDVPFYLWGTEGEQAYIDARRQADVVGDPEIASTGGDSGVNSGRLGCTRFDVSKSCNGVNGRKFHDGTDILAAPGEPVDAIYGGTVVAIQAGYTPGTLGDRGYGNYIEVETTLTNGLVLPLKYAQLDGVGVKVGDHVSSGENIGTAGSTGNAALPTVPNKHIHIRARLEGASVDPETYIPTNFDDNGQATEGGN